jgi:mannitol/fructose-specific phosphotransferase system IIA component (Ntr-type)
MKSKPLKSVRLFGAPEPEKFASTPEGKVLTESAAIHFKSKTDKRINKLLAIEKLVLDIFQDSQAARAFAVNPDEYLRRYGFSNVKLDLNSQEVRIAMAIGDPLARQAATRGDVEGFIDAILAQGVRPSIGMANFVHVEAVVHSSVVVYSIAVVVTFQKVVTATAIPIVVLGGPIVEKAHHLKVLSQIAKHIGDEAFSKQVASKKAEHIIEKYTELIQKKLNTPIK